MFLSRKSHLYLQFFNIYYYYNDLFSPKPAAGGRADLLAAIQTGRRLRKVDDTEKKISPMAGGTGSSESSTAASGGGGGLDG